MTCLLPKSMVMSVLVIAQGQVMVQGSEESLISMVPVTSGGGYAEACSLEHCLG